MTDSNNGTEQLPGSEKKADAFRSKYRARRDERTWTDASPLA